MLFHELYKSATQTPDSPSRAHWQSPRGLQTTTESIGERDLVHQDQAPPGPVRLWRGWATRVRPDPGSARRGRPCGKCHYLENEVAGKLET
jgi:hypothetical protein